MVPVCQEGDILLYYGNPNWIDRGIEWFEQQQDPGDDIYVYHVAIAVSAFEQIAADRRVELRPITLERAFIICSPPIPKGRVDVALGKLRAKMLGKIYGYMLIADDAVRYLTKGRFGLPKWLMKLFPEPDCSWLVALFWRYAMWGPKLGRNVSPQDILRIARPWQVYPDRRMPT